MKNDRNFKGIAALERAEMKHIGIVIVEPRQLVREGIECLLQKPPFEIIAAGKTLVEATTGGCDLTRADIIIFGSSLEEEFEEQMAAISRLPAASSRPRFVFVSERREPSLLRKALAAGVDAVLSEDISSKVLQRSLELVALGQQLFPISLVRAITSVAEPSPASNALQRAVPALLAPSSVPALAGNRFIAQSEINPLEKPERVMLSKRENQILGFLVSAFSNKAIARELQITEATVKVHIKALLRKVRASNRTQAAVWALTSSKISGPISDEAVELPALSISSSHLSV